VVGFEPPSTRRTFGTISSNIVTASRRSSSGPVGSPDDLVEAVETLDDVSQKWRRMLGPQHPDYPAVENALNRTREALAQARASK